ncbi:MAG TPA: hypothetical protein V6C65_38905 [Allocoleopsis sp.]
MDKKEENPEYVQPLELYQCEEGYIEIYKNFIGVGDGKWEPMVKKN